MTNTQIELGASILDKIIDRINRNIISKMHYKYKTRQQLYCENNDIRLSHEHF